MGRRGMVCLLSWWGLGSSREAISMSVLQTALEPSTLVLAVDPGKVSNRVWLSDGSGLLVEPLSMPVSRAGLSGVERLVASHRGSHPAVVVAVEATGSLHRAWSSALERSFPGAVRLFAPSETKAARTQLGSGRFKTDDRDCAALTYLARQGGGRRWVDEGEIDALRAVVRHRRGLVHDRKIIQQRLHDQLKALARGCRRRRRTAAGWPWTSHRVRRCWPARWLSLAARRRCGHCKPERSAGSAGPTRTTGGTGGAAVFPRHQTLSSVRNGWTVISPGTRRCRLTLPRSRRTWSRCLPAPAGRS